MSRSSANRIARQGLIEKYISGNPFLTDEDLAETLGVSIQTIRLDRSEMSIPEMRLRVKNVASGVYGQVRSIGVDEMIGELVDLEIGRSGISVLTITGRMALKKTKVTRGHYLFAQANSLAVALVDSEVVLTGTSKISYKRPVFSGERVVARGYISRKSGNRYMVRVTSTVRDEIVFTGKFLVFAIPEEVWRR
ncbi:MAG: DeoR faimly transcriptional regulator [Peptococcaceae bacterium BICA1-7]|nr:MAG: DeoR faimly transcriptional regulator [Peptococcaceae bacterium BICA1-7]HBV96496.1 transcription factor FapR [Desulfotomaculum sp.]